MCFSRKQTGRDLSYSLQALLCVQWAYLLMVLLNSEAFSFLPELLTLYLGKLCTSRVIAWFSVCVERSDSGCDSGEAIAVHRSPRDKSLGLDAAQLYYSTHPWSPEWGSGIEKLKNHKRKEGEKKKNNRMPPLSFFSTVPVKMFLNAIWQIISDVSIHVLLFDF